MASIVTKPVLVEKPIDWAKQWRRVQPGHYVIVNYALVERGPCTGDWWWFVRGGKYGRAMTLRGAKYAVERVLNGKVEKNPLEEECKLLRDAVNEARPHVYRQKTSGQHEQDRQDATEWIACWVESGFVEKYPGEQA